MLKYNQLFLITLSVMFFYACKKAGNNPVPIPMSLDSLSLASPNYTPNNGEYVNGVLITKTMNDPRLSEITDYGYYLSINNGNLQKVSLGKTPQSGFSYKIDKLLPATLYMIKGYVTYAGHTFFAPILTFTTYPGTWSRLHNFTAETFIVGGHGPSGFSVNGKGYVMFNNGHLYQYNVANDTWAAKKAFNLNYPNLQEVPHAFFTINNIAYLYFRGGVWKYDDVGDSWTNILQQALPVTLSGSAFVVNNKAYILQCAQHGYPQVLSRVYDPVANTLQAINMTSNQSESTGFATKNFVYILSSQAYQFGSNTVYPAFMYNPVDDTYTKMDNGVDVGPFANRLGGVSFTINGKAYVGEGSTRQLTDEYYVYNEQATPVQPISRQFSAVDDGANIGGRYNGASFVINGKAYVGFGDGGRTDFWEFTP